MGGGYGSGLFLGPVAWSQELVDALLGGAGFGPIIVGPAHYRGQGHEDGFGAAAGFKAEDGAAVIEEVEFDVAAAAELLEGPLGVRVGEVLAAADDGEISVQKSVAGVLDEGEQGREIALQVVEKDAA